jgi:hypothetical protein
LGGCGGTEDGGDSGGDGGGGGRGGGGGGGEVTVCGIRDERERERERERAQHVGHVLSTDLLAAIPNVGQRRLTRLLELGVGAFLHLRHTRVLAIQCEHSQVMHPRIAHREIPTCISVCATNRFEMRCVDNMPGRDGCRPEHKSMHIVVRVGEGG